MRPIRHIAIAAVFVAIMGVFSSAAQSEPQPVSLATYAFNFPTYGFEITVSGKTRLTYEPLAADGRIRIKEEGYSLRSLLSGMNRDDRQAFVAFYNDHCFIKRGQRQCNITASGEVELDDDMQMIFRIQKARLWKDGNVLTVGAP